MAEKKSVFCDNKIYNKQINNTNTINSNFLHVADCGVPASAGI